MSNPERRAQSKIGGSVSAETRPAETWDDLQNGWDVPTVVDGEAKPPTTPSDAHDDAAMLDRVRVAIQDSRRADQTAAQVYAEQEAAGRAAQVGDRVDLINDVPDVVAAFPEDAPLPLRGEEDDEVDDTEVDKTEVDKTEDTFRSLDSGPLITQLPDRKKITGFA